MTNGSGVYSLRTTNKAVTNIASIIPGILQSWFEFGPNYFLSGYQN